METQPTDARPLLDRSTVGRSAEHWRMRANLTASEVGRRMAAAGHKTWRPDVVLAVEVGRREVKATELPELATALGVDVERLLAGPDDDGARRVLRLRAAELSATCTEVVSSVADLVSRLERAEAALGRSWYSLHPLDAEGHPDPSGDEDPDEPLARAALSMARGVLANLGNPETRAMFAPGGQLDDLSAILGTTPSAR